MNVKNYNYNMLDQTGGGSRIMNSEALCSALEWLTTRAKTKSTRGEKGPTSTWWQLRC